MMSEPLEMADYMKDVTSKLDVMLERLTTEQQVDALRTAYLSCVMDRRIIQEMIP
jgi:hypothetical protein